MRFSGQEYWIGLPCPPPGDLPNPGIKPGFLALQEYWLPLNYQGSTYIYAAAKLLQSSLTLCDPMNRSTPGLPVHHQLLEITETHAH